MNDFLEILKYTLPGILVLLATVITLRMLLRNDEKRRQAELMMENKDTMLPLRLQAYERLILFLERISPDSLIMRVNVPDMSSSQLQNELITHVRTEFEHNLAQQMYISSKAWDAVKSARNNVIKLVNDAATGLKPNSPGMSLNKKILDKLMEQNASPTASAVEFLKKEVRELF
jgi:hypothetical protein